MTRKLLFAAFLLTLVLTFISLNHQLTNASANVAPPPRHAPPIDGVKGSATPTWQVMAGGGGKDLDLHDVDMVSPNEGWAVGVTGPLSYGVIMHYTNTTWSLANIPTSTFAINAVKMISPTEGWAAGYRQCSYGCDGDLLMHYTASTGWQTVTVPASPSPDLRSGFSGIDITGTVGWAVGGYYEYGYDTYDFKFDGTSWTPIAAPMSGGTAVSIVDANEAWVAGGNRLAHFQNSQWSIVAPSLPPNASLKSIHMLNANEGWAVGYASVSFSPPAGQCVMLHYVWGTWVSVPCSSSSQLLSVRMRNSNDVWAVGTDGLALHYDGKAWSQVSVPAGNSTLRSVKLVGADDGWIVGSGGTILRLVSGNWTRVSGSELGIGSLDAVSATEAWYGGADGNLYQWKNGTVSTHTSGVDMPVQKLDMISSTLGWASVGSSPSNYFLKVSDGNWAITPTDSILALSMVSPDEGWAGTYSGLLHYLAGTWQPDPVLGTTRIGSLSMLDANHGWAMRYGGGSVYTYTDGIWGPITSTLNGLLNVIAMSPDEAWLAGHAYLGCTSSECSGSSRLYHYVGGTWETIPTPDWLAFYDISKVSATEWWAVGKRTPWEYAFLHYKDGAFTVVSAGGEDVQEISMLPDGSGFARGVGSLLRLGPPITASGLALVHTPPIQEPVARLATESASGTTNPQVIVGGGGRDIGLSGVSSVSPDEAWAVGVTGPSSYGVIMHYTHTTWSRVNIPTGTYGIDAVTMISPTEGWAVGYSACSYGTCDTGLLMHYTANSGWQSATLPARPDGGHWDLLTDIDIRNSTGWIVGRGFFSPYYFLRLDGTSWIPITAPINATGVSIVSADEAWAVGQDQSNDASLAHFSNGSWSNVRTPPLPDYTYLKDIYMLNANEGWAVGYVASQDRFTPHASQCIMLHYAGGLWIRASCPSSTRLQSVYARNANDVWAVGWEGPALHFQGSKWSPVALLSPAQASWFVGLGANDGWVAGSHGAILRWENGGWARSSGSDVWIGAVDAVSLNEAWYGNDNGELIQWKDGKVMTFTSQVPLEITALDMVSPTVGWAGAGRYGSSNYILKYSNDKGNITWVVTSTGIHEVTAISMVGPEEGWFATLGSGILHYKNGNWGAESIGASNLTSVSMLDGNYGWAAGYTMSSNPYWQGKVFNYYGTWNALTVPATLGGDWGDLKVVGISPDEAWVVGWTDDCSSTGCPASPQLYHISSGIWTRVNLPNWLALYDISKVSSTEWWATGELTTMQYAYLHYKNGTYTTVPVAGEDVLGISMLPNGTGFARGVGSILKVPPYQSQIFLPVVVKH